MLLTEEEAKTKWCPLIAHNAHLCSLSDELRRDKGAKCVASACMAWRVTQIDVASANYFQRIADDFRAGRKIDAIKMLRSVSGIGLKEAKDRCEAGDYSGLTRTVGFCGAFGKVELP